jgi:hypothetical protein
MDYIFYRIYLYYKKKEDSPIFTGILFLLILRACVLFFIVSIINILTGGFLSNHNPDLKKEYFYTVYGIVLFVFLVLDILRYSKTAKIKEFEIKYHNRKANYIIKTWMIFIIPILLFILSIFLSVVFSDHVSGLLIRN